MYVWGWPFWGGPCKNTAFFTASTAGTGIANEERLAGQAGGWGFQPQDRRARTSITDWFPMKRRLFGLVTALVISVVPDVTLAHHNEAPAVVRIGVYDSRAVAVAWAGSEFNPMHEKMQEFAAAKAANDTPKVAALEAWGQTQQRLMHLQGFGRVPVGDLLVPVQDQLRQLMIDRGLAAVTMHCDQVSDQVELVDVTMDIVGLYNPSPRTIQWASELREKQPLPLVELIDLPANK